MLKGIRMHSYACRMDWARLTGGTLTQGIHNVEFNEKVDRFICARDGFNKWAIWGTP